MDGDDKKPYLDEQSTALSEEDDQDRDEASTEEVAIDAPKKKKKKSKKKSSAGKENRGDDRRQNRNSKGKKRDSSGDVPPSMDAVTSRTSVSTKASTDAATVASAASTSAASTLSTSATRDSAASSTSARNKIRQSRSLEECEQEEEDDVMDTIDLSRAQTPGFFAVGSSSAVSSVPVRPAPVPTREPEESMEEPSIPIALPAQVVTEAVVIAEVAPTPITVSVDEQLPEEADKFDHQLDRLEGKFQIDFKWCLIGGCLVVVLVTAMAASLGVALANKNETTNSQYQHGMPTPFPTWAPYTYAPSATSPSNWAPQDRACLCYEYFQAISFPEPVSEFTSSQKQTLHKAWSEFEGDWFYDKRKLRASNQALSNSWHPRRKLQEDWQVHIDRLLSYALPHNDMFDYIPGMPTSAGNYTAFIYHLTVCDDDVVPHELDSIHSRYQSWMASEQNRWDMLDIMKDYGFEHATNLTHAVLAGQCS